MAKNRGFTLIELLVVIAIIGILSSVVLTSLATARTKADDARVLEDMHSINLALNLYYSTNNAYPPNKTPCCGYPSTQSDFLSELVAGGFIPRVPTPPNSKYTYYYYNYGAGSAPGAIVVTSLLGVPPSVTGKSGSCRPWTAGANWCDQSSNTYYCICNTY